MFQLRGDGEEIWKEVWKRARCRQTMEGDENAEVERLVSEDGELRWCFL